MLNEFSKAVCLFTESRTTILINAAAEFISFQQQIENSFSSTFTAQFYLVLSKNLGVSRDEVRNIHKKLFQTFSHVCPRKTIPKEL